MKKILILLISLIFISCSDSDNLSVVIFDENTFDKNRELWTENEILNYTFSQKYSSSSTGFQPILTSVVKNRELDTIFLKSESDINIESLSYYGTIDDAYNFIENIVNICKEEINSGRSMEGAEIEVEYNDSFHYPTKIYCTGFYPEGIVGGLGINIIISDFEVIQ